MYKSPIEISMGQIETQIAKQNDEMIYKAIVNCGINVDKEELIRALQYDRNQYQKGYQDGKAAAMASIVYCHECCHSKMCACLSGGPDRLLCFHGTTYGHPLVRPVEDGHYCSYGERRTDNG